MERFVKGEIVVLPFPFSDLSHSKKRPAFVLADLSGDDIILCQITSQSSKDMYAIALENSDFVSGSLPVSSFVRPSRIFTADKNIIIRTAGRVNHSTVEKVIKCVVELVSK